MVARMLKWLFFNWIKFIFISIQKLTIEFSCCSDCSLSPIFKTPTWSWNGAEGVAIVISASRGSRSYVSAQRTFCCGSRIKNSALMIMRWITCMAALAKLHHFNYLSPGSFSFNQPLQCPRAGCPGCLHWLSCLVKTWMLLLSLKSCEQDIFISMVPSAINESLAAP